MTKTELLNVLSELPRDRHEDDEFSFYVSDDMEVHYYKDTPILLYIIKNRSLYVLSSPDKTAEEHIKSVYATGVNSGTLELVLYLYRHSPLLMYKSYKGMQPIRVSEELYQNFIERKDFSDYLCSSFLDEAIYHTYEAIYDEWNEDYFMQEEQKC